ncbi:MAG: ORF1 protein [Thetatorquevirus procy6]|uniref:Capsid protein n=1 Tax=Anelloviridae sp. TaxID=2055263 RepID=A0A3G2YSS7_9VIRU|nr:MAG: ORF1 protein [Anelloviridae sp.]AYP28697.1 MAG: ORF1 protein [Anelloviridae sp.]
MPFWRRRRYRRRPYYRRRWRPYTRRRRRPLRSRFQRYRRRKVRRRGKRRVLTVKQWQPQHRRRCTIFGWHIGLWTSTITTTGPFQAWVPKTDESKGYFEVQDGGGGVALWHFSLWHLYQEFLLHRNRWSTSNQGFDLVKYRGTSFTFFPHPAVDYIVWWEVDFRNPSYRWYRKAHPSQAILERNHAVVLSIPHRGRKKKITLKPPSTFLTQWQFMDEFCMVKFLKLSIALFNIEDPFAHKTGHPGKVKIGYIITKENDNTSRSIDGTRVPTSTSGTSPNWGVIAQGNEAYYSWFWDSGQDNKIAVAKSLTDTSDSAKIYLAEGVPYWLLFYGAGSDYFPLGFKAWIWWWPESARSQYDLQEFIKDTKTDANYRHEKQWIFLGSATDGSFPYLSAQLIAGVGPFVYSSKDMTPTVTHSIFFKYKSRWTWGGVGPRPADLDDPCTVTPAGTDTGNVHVSNPLRVRREALHPWDFDAAGILTKAKLREIVGFDLAELSGLPRSPETLPPKRPLTPSTDDSSAESLDYPSAAPKRSKREDRPPSEEEESLYSFTEDTLPVVEEDPQKLTERKLDFILRRLRRERKFRRKLKHRIRRFLT